MISYYRHTHTHTRTVVKKSPSPLLYCSHKLLHHNSVAHSLTTREGEQAQARPRAGPPCNTLTKAQQHTLGRARRFAVGKGYLARAPKTGRPERLNRAKDSRANESSDRARREALNSSHATATLVLASCSRELTRWLRAAAASSRGMRFRQTKKKKKARDALYDRRAFNHPRTNRYLCVSVCV